MALSKEQFQQLLRLQEQDKALDSLQAEIDKVPADVQSIKTALEAEKSRLAEIKAASTKLQMTKKEREIELSQKEEAVRKHGQELNSVKTNEAYKALQSEIDKAKAAAGDLETAILTLMDEIDQVSREEKAELAKFKGQEAKAQEQIQALDADHARLKAKADEERAKRNALLAGLPEDVLKLYEYLRKRKQGVALSAVQGNICSVCHITILPQSLVEIVRGARLVTCDSCQRILYHPVPAEQPAAARRFAPAADVLGDAPLSPPPAAKS